MQRPGDEQEDERNSPEPFSYMVLMGHSEVNKDHLESLNDALELLCSIVS